MSNLNEEVSIKLIGKITILFPQLEVDLVNKKVYIHNILFNKVGCIDYEWWMDIQQSDDININDPEEVKQFILDYIGDFPLLTEGQLRNFIEDKTDSNIIVQPSMEGKYHVGYDKYCAWSESGDYSGVVYCDDVLEAYWKVAVDIAKQC